MRFPKGLMTAFLAFASFKDAAAFPSTTPTEGPYGLRKHMLVLPHSRTDDLIPFNDLHSGLLADQPGLTADATPGPRLRILNKYPATIFYDRQPVFSDDRWGLGFSKQGLKEAYNTFGRVHLYHRDNFLTLSPDHVGQQRHASEGLEDFLRKVQFIRQHFGDHAAIAAYGWQGEPLDRAPRGVARMFRKGPASAQPESEDYNLIRDKLNRRRSVLIHANREGFGSLSTLRLDLDAHGNIRPSVSGILAEAARDVHI